MLLSCMIIAKFTSTDVVHVLLFAFRWKWDLPHHVGLSIATRQRFFMLKPGHECVSTAQVF